MMSTPRRKVVLASRNPDKVKELQGLMADTPFAVLSAADFPGLPDVIEDGTTIEGNATRKALLTAAWTGEIAEGLLASRGGGVPDAVVVPDPRIWSTRSPEASETPRTDVAPAGLDAAAPGRGSNEELFLQITAMGRLMGTITRQPVGGLGFGYDPVFRPEVGQRTLAELEVEEKNAVSHRGRALRRLLAGVRTAYGLA